MFKEVKNGPDEVVIIYDAKEIDWLHTVAGVYFHIFRIRPGAGDPNLIIGPNGSARYWMAPPVDGEFYVVHLENQYSSKPKPVDVIVTITDESGEEPVRRASYRSRLESDKEVVFGGTYDSPKMSGRIFEITPLSLPNNGRIEIVVYEKPWHFTFRQLKEAYGSEWQTMMRGGRRVLTDDVLELKG